MSACTSYRLSNPGLGFVRDLMLRLLCGVIRNVRVGTSRAKAPLVWDNAVYRPTLSGDSAELHFDRPENWPHRTTEVDGEGGNDLQGALLPAPERSHRALRAMLRGRRIAFLGTARNCAAVLPASIARLRGLAGFFGAAEIHLFENDSDDGTGDWLSARAAEGQLFAHHEAGVAGRMPRRTERLAHARNRLLDLVLARDPWCYRCWADLDGLVGERFSDEGFLSCCQLDEVRGTPCSR